MRAVYSLLVGISLSERVRNELKCEASLSVNVQYILVHMYSNLFSVNANESTDIKCFQKRFS